jgi:CHAT domain-containing protein
MEHFYRLWLVDGMSPAMALRGAQIWLRDRIDQTNGNDAKTRHIGDLAAEQTAADGYAHPFWWAAFSLTGV